MVYYNKGIVQLLRDFPLHTTALGGGVRSLALDIREHSQLITLARKTIAPSDCKYNLKLTAVAIM